MPANDQYLRNIKSMHVVFAVSSVVLLFATLMMMGADHDDEWRDYQKTFYRIEGAELREAKEAVETDEFLQELDSLLAEQTEQQTLLDERVETLNEAKREVNRLEAETDLKSRAVRTERAQRDVARANLDLGIRDRLSQEKLEALKAVFDVRQANVNRLELELEQLTSELNQSTEILKILTAEKDEVVGKIKEQTAGVLLIDRALNKVSPPERTLAWYKRKIMEWPIVDGFNSHIQIKNDWIPDLKIQIGMAETSRYDRCRTCHLGIASTGAGNVPTYPHGDVDSDDPEDWVRHNEFPHPFSTHPRPDVYLSATSPHPVETFGCTGCHDGQGSGTSFSNAAHTPNDPHQDEVWLEEFGYASNHFWEYPMFPKRFRESSCLKCHHNVVELGESPEFGPTAPKVYEGWRLVRDFGCFGCHEIRGYDGETPIGPDLRLEPSYEAVALQILSFLKPLASSKPGDEKSAPKSASGVSLARIRDLALEIVSTPAESQPAREQLRELISNDQEAKSAAWLEKVKAGGELKKAKAKLDSEFLPLEITTLADGLKNADLPGLMRKVGPSLRYLKSKTTRGWIEYWTENPKRFRPSTRMPQFFDLSNQQDPHAIEFKPVELAGIAQYLLDKSDDLALDKPKQDYKADVERGAALFSERGCLACHQHEKFQADTNRLDADFGPNLSRVHLKIKPGQEGFEWLYTWLRDPQKHHARTRMPNLFLEPQGEGDTYVDPAADIAAFILEGGRGEYEPIHVNQESLNELVTRFLAKAVTTAQVEKTMADRNYPIIRELIKGDEIELSLADGAKKADDEQWRQMKLNYVGRRTISRYGCYGCHDIPGFEQARPIGTNLQDWGRKDTSKLAVEHVEEYLEEPKATVLAIKFADEAKANKALESIHSVDDFQTLAAARQAKAQHADDVFSVSLVEGQHHEWLGDTHHIFELPDGGWTHEPLTSDHGVYLALVEKKTESLAARVERSMKEAAAGAFSNEEEAARELAPAYFYESLLHHGRAGFLWQKLRAPRSYDFEKVETKGYDERLRMPKFPFDEEQIEAIATFVLGLVAEPPAEQYVFQPTGPDLDRIRGEALLQKFNCVGCHMVELPEFRYGVDPERLTSAVPQGEYTDEVLEVLLRLKPPVDAITGETISSGDGENAKQLHVISFHGLTYQEPDPEEEDPEFREYSVDLWESLQVGEKLVLPPTRMLIPETQLVSISDPKGGKFSEWLARELQRTGRAENLSFGWQKSVPPLYKEGVKVQTPWLYRFLKNPHKLRHLAVLRMPKFNLNDDEARTLANYFAAVDGAAYPYQRITEREPPYLEMMERVFDEKFPDKTDDYLVESWHLLNDNLCIKCHSVGGREVAGDPEQAKKGKEQIRGPNLDHATDRLRPDWLKLWILSPTRLTPYTSMPLNFKQGGGIATNLFGGDGYMQTIGVRDALINYDRLMEREGKYVPPQPSAPKPEAKEGTND